MANYATLKGLIDQYITTNGQGDITGAILNEVLKGIINSIGTDYLFGGIVKPSSNVGTPDQNVFFIATQGGSYRYFDEVVIPNGITIFKWNGSWSYQILVAGDGGVFDITAYHNGTKYANLTAALGVDGTNIPESLQKGGMSVKFVQSSDDKYVQYRLMSASFDTTPANWTSDILDGYVYKGVAVANTNPGTPTGKVFYLGIEYGATYTHFGGIQHNNDYLLNILRWDGSSWHSDTGIYIMGAIEDSPAPVKSAAIKAVIDPIRKSFYFSNYNTLNKNVIGLYLNGLDRTKTYRVDNIGYYPDSAKITLYIYDTSDDTLVASLWSSQFKGLNVIPDRGKGISGYCVFNFDETTTDKRVSGLIINNDIVSNIEYSPSVLSKLNEYVLNGLPQYTVNDSVEQFIQYVCIEGYTENNIPKLGFYIESNYINIQLLDGNNNLKVVIGTVFKTLVDEVQYFSKNQNGVTLNIAINLKGLYNAKYKGTGLTVYASEYNYAFRYPIPVSGKIDKLNFDKKDNFIVDANGGGDFQSLTQAIIYATAFMDKHVYINAGTYDIIQEFQDIYGANFFSNYVQGNLRGIYLQNRVHLHFSPSAKVFCNYTGSNSNVQLWFAPFNSGKYGFEIDGLHLESSKVRYSIHDERDQDTDGYYNIYRNCYIKHDKQDGAGYILCIGGGLGCNGKILIENCIFDSIGALTSQAIISYHNTAAAGKSFIVLKDSYFITGTFRIGYYGQSTDITKAIVSNCSLKSSPYKNAEAGSTNDNMELIAWNNDIRQ